jgi:hypothetical protein
MPTKATARLDVEMNQGSEPLSGIAYRGHPRRAWVVGSGLDVWEIIELVAAYGGDLDRVQRYHPRVTRDAAQTAETDAERFPDEIKAFVAANRRGLPELRELYSFLEV